MERELIERETLLQAIIDAEPECVKLLAADGSVRLMNPAGLRRVGAESYEEVADQCIYPMIVPEHRAQFQALTETVFRGESGTLEFEFVSLNGERLWLETHASPLRDHRGAVVSLLGITRDITERKRIAEALRASEERLRLALDAAHMGTYDWEVSHNRITWSRVHEELWGFGRGEFNGTYEAFAGRIHPADRPLVDAEVARCRAAREPCSLEYRVVWPDGSIHWVMGKGRFTFDEMGEAVRMRGIVMEITERKQAQDALRDLTTRLLQAEDEERRRIAKELHDSTAQDLIAVTLELGMLREALPPGDMKPAQTIEDCAALLENCANDIRTLSYLLHPPRLDELGLAGGIAEYAAGLGRRSDVRIRVEAPPDFGRLPEEVELVLFRVAQESLSNVVRHSKSDVATVRLTRDESSVALEIQDYGGGMPVKATARPGARGVGIAGMRERLEHLGGRLEIVSGRDGTVVRARLPLGGGTKWMH